MSKSKVVADRQANFPGLSKKQARRDAAKPTPFAAALLLQLQRRKLDSKRKRILGIITDPPGALRTRRLARMESAARVVLDIGERDAVDWAAVDWQLWFETIMKFLLALLPFLL